MKGSRKKDWGCERQVPRYNETTPHLSLVTTRVQDLRGVIFLKACGIKRKVRWKQVTGIYRQKDVNRKLPRRKRQSCKPLKIVCVGRGFRVEVLEGAEAGWKWGCSACRSLLGLRIVELNPKPLSVDLDQVEGQNASQRFS